MILWIRISYALGLGGSINAILPHLAGTTACRFVKVLFTRRLGRPVRVIYIQNSGGECLGLASVWVGFAPVSGHCQCNEPKTMFGRQAGRITGQRPQRRKPVVPGEGLLSVSQSVFIRWFNHSTGHPRTDGCLSWLSALWALFFHFS